MASTDTKEFKFTLSDKRVADFIQAAHKENPSLNYDQLIGRVQVEFGRQELSLRVKRWLRASLGDFRQYKKEVMWRRGERVLADEEFAQSQAGREGKKDDQKDDSKNQK